MTNDTELTVKPNVRENKLDLAGLQKGITLTREIMERHLPDDKHSLRLVHGACDGGWTLRYAKRWQLRLYCAKCGAYAATVPLKKQH